MLTSEEIAKASCIIVAADKSKCGNGPFRRKTGYSSQVADGIHKADELLTEALSGQVAIYHHQDGKDAPPEVGRKAGDMLLQTPDERCFTHAAVCNWWSILIALAFCWMIMRSIRPTLAATHRSPPCCCCRRCRIWFHAAILAGYIAMISQTDGAGGRIHWGYIAKVGMTFANPAGGAFTSGFLGGTVGRLHRRLSDCGPAKGV